MPHSVVVVGNDNVIVQRSKNTQRRDLQYCRSVQQYSINSKTASGTVAHYSSSTTVPGCTGTSSTSVTGVCARLGMNVVAGVLLPDDANFTRIA